MPSSFRCRFWLRSTAVPRMSVDAYRFNNCFPSIARKAGGKGGEEDSLDLNDEEGRTRPIRYDGNVASEGGVVDLVEKDTEEGGGLFVRVRLELGVDRDDKRGGDGGEQTSL